MRERERWGLRQNHQDTGARLNVAMHTLLPVCLCVCVIHCCAAIDSADRGNSLFYSSAQCPFPSVLPSPPRTSEEVSRHQAVDQPLIEFMQIKKKKNIKVSVQTFFLHSYTQRYTHCWFHFMAADTVYIGRGARL